MSRLTASLGLDVRLQSRSGLYAVGVMAAVLFGLAGRFIFSAEHAGRVLAGFYFLAIGSTTYMFGASVVLLEKSDGTLSALRTTPLTARDYLLSKVLTLSAFAVIESAIVYCVGFWGSGVSILLLLVGVLALGPPYVCLGLGQVAPHDSVFGFLIPWAVVVSMVLQLPVFYLLDIGPAWLWHLIPTHGPLLLMLGASEPLEPWRWGYAVVVSLASLGLSAWWARRRFATHIRLQEGSA